MCTHSHIVHIRAHRPGLFMGHDVRVPLSCSLINNNHDMSAQWAAKSSISTDQMSRGLLPLDWDWEKCAHDQTTFSKTKHQKKINIDAFGNQLINFNHLILFSFSSKLVKTGLITIVFGRHCLDINMPNMCSFSSLFLNHEQGFILFPSCNEIN